MFPNNGRTQASMANREGLVYARGYLKLAEIFQRFGVISKRFLFEGFAFDTIYFPEVLGGMAKHTS